MEDVYYTTIDEMMKGSPANKPEPVYSEMTDGKDSKEPRYMDIPEGSYSNQLNKGTMRYNPAYFILSEHQVNLQDNPAYSTSANIN